MSRPEVHMDDSLARDRVGRPDGIDRARECVLVALAGGPESVTLLRRGARLAARAGGQLHAVHATHPSRDSSLTPGALVQLRNLTADLDGAFHAVVAADTAEAVLELARGLHASTIVVGASRRRRWTAPFRAGVSDRIVTGSGDIDVLLVTHPYARTTPLRPPPSTTQALSGTRRLAGWILALTTPALLTAALRPFDSSPTPASEGLAFLAVTVVCALVGGLWPALTAALLSSLMLNYFFTPPRHTLTIASAEDVLTLLLFLLVALLVASVVGTAARRSQQAAQARREADTLSMLNQTLLRGDHDLAELLELVCDTFAVRSAALLHRPRPDGSADGTAPWRVLASSGSEPPHAPDEADSTAEASASTRLALSGRPLPPRDMRVLSAFATHLAVVADRERLAAQTAAAQRLAEGNRMRTALLAAVSHDLRTPLAGIKAAVSTLRTADVTWSAEDQAELLAAIEDSTDRLGVIITNLLDMSRLQTGAVHLVSQDVGLDDVVSRALRTLPDPERVDLDVAADLPPVRVDSGLLERVVANLVENALRYSPTHTRVQVSAEVTGTRVRLRVIDHGPGVPDTSKPRLFQPFQRLGDAPAGEGVGLGLAVAAGLTAALGGTLSAHDTPGGGLTMVVDLVAAPESPRAQEPDPTEDLDPVSAGPP